MGKYEELFEQFNTLKPTDAEFRTAAGHDIDKLARIAERSGNADIYYDNSDYLQMLIAEQIRQNRFEMFSETIYNEIKKERAANADTLNNQNNLSRKPIDCQVTIITIKEAQL